MSDFARNQLAQLSTRMNGGYPRWQSQNLRKLRLPVLDWLSAEIKEKLIAAFQKQDVNAINDALQQAPLPDTGSGPGSWSWGGEAAPGLGVGL
ncbi:MAG: hypothetical protein H6559_37875 [Lewinellaceae bacterium]|nr:hypothetical protein [Lewinellaceae bacterium]